MVTPLLLLGSLAAVWLNLASYDIVSKTRLHSCDISRPEHHPPCLSALIPKIFFGECHMLERLCVARLGSFCTEGFCMIGEAKTCHVLHVLK